MIGGVDEQLHLVAEPGKAFARQFVRFGILIGQPARRVDAVEHIVGDVEGEVEALAIVLDVAVQREILRVGGGLRTAGSSP